MLNSIARGVSHCIIVSILILIAPKLQAGVIVNGDFSDAVDLAGFTAIGNAVSEPTGEFGQLESDGGFLRTLQQPFGIPGVPSVLSFDFAFSTDASSPPTGFPDSFAVSILTALDGDFLDILVVDALGVLPDPSDGFEAVTGAVPIDVAFDSSVSIPGFTPFANGTTFNGRVSMPFPGDVAGENATIFFDLFDELDNANSVAAVDNLSVRTVPEPAALFTWSLLLVFGILVRLKSRRRVSSCATLGTRTKGLPTGAL